MFMKSAASVNFVLVISFDFSNDLKVRNCQRSTVCLKLEHLLAFPAPRFGRNG